jgi:hypothetical protein
VLRSIHRSPPSLLHSHGSMPLNVVILSCALALNSCGRIGIDFQDDLDRVASGGQDGMGGDVDGGDGDSSAAGGEPGETGVGWESSAIGGASSGGADAGGSDAGGTNAGGAGGTLTEAGGSDGAGGEAMGAGGEGTGAGGASSTGGASGVGGMLVATGGAGANDCDLSDPLCAEIAEVLVNRYSFDGTETIITDSIGGRPGTAYGGATLDGSGKLDLSGMNQYVELEPDPISSYPNVSFEIWFVWRGGEAWQKLFEFGSHDALFDPVDYIYATPEAGGSDPSNNALAGAIRHNDAGERQVRSSAFTEIGMLIHVALVVSDDLNRLSLYKNGKWLVDRDADIQLDQFADDTHRLGRSLFPEDPYFNGEIHEFRIYGEVLTPEMIAKSYEVGPDAVFSTN